MSLAAVIALCCIMAVAGVPLLWCLVTLIVGAVLIHGMIRRGF